MTASILQSLQIRPFTPADQAATRQLILEGLAQRFDTFDASMNPDLDDIEAHYVMKGAHFYVAHLPDGTLIGTCALTFDTPTIGRIERVSVAHAYQRQGIGRWLTQFLIDTARQMQLSQLRVETNEDWTSALRLYQQFGFQETHRYQAHFVSATQPDYIETVMEVNMVLRLDE